MQENTCLCSCRPTVFNLSNVSIGNLCNTVPINGSLAVFIKSVVDDELILFDANVFSLFELVFEQFEFLLPNLIKSLGCCTYKENIIINYVDTYIINILF